MNKSHISKKTVQALLVLMFILSATHLLSAQEPDKPFVQATSVKYYLHESLKGATVKKIVVDYNDIVYVLSDKGLLRINDKELVRDLR